MPGRMSGKEQHRNAANYKFDPAISDSKKAVQYSERENEPEQELSSISLNEQYDWI